MTLEQICDVYGALCVLMQNTRLISDAPGVSTAHEVKNVEVLKLRFGDSALRDCEVMIRDLEDSRHLNAMLVKDTVLRVVVTSEVFWPCMCDEPLQLHPCSSSVPECCVHMNLDDAALLVL